MRLYGIQMRDPHGAVGFVDLDTYQADQGGRATYLVTVDGSETRRVLWEFTITHEVSDLEVAVIIAGRDV